MITPGLSRFTEPSRRYCTVLLPLWIATYCHPPPARNRLLRSRRQLRFGSDHWPGRFRGPRLCHYA
jgi:hypothetical protein